MADGELAQIIDAAHEAIKGRPSMVLDGNPHEELARALERHATRLDEAAKGLEEVGQVNHLGPTREGEAATYNIRLGAVEHERSLHRTYLAQAVEARSLASSIRETGRRILRTEGFSQADISRVIGN
ncbi:putative protein OS=Tsukamurella paurometabola (strain ATCC 8368 / DSM / CCUG 35730 /CIP 100753 / JCM 10117 / KCTC 9821 / NBRC 16120 / NCIMB 702349/ NCTC 13040) OX=521096 GN=Tpau_1312 PE=4 SV=1 [Tsukamurella paurometabola]|uniref:Uncharacterized protein n=1 Tax=Tsukamurella paurometabola (strain ATCC 8368 / DSM 20162 / CCUG 35730 / CIP 100753 / JCM 10117 / KCTC 9821 / NBRC 16120 / NCIMB 702349 / NCTC 13040) TaxID=521096 RepID=D5UWR9_TSUPD|nr:hypothetical protein [Tsukamurella paurometabola]ADG77941.1 hypothetical protein Tpau_1312 [Tsukamurella paurometabola DSM 20162]SUP29455.1 Uncharacterised protein [Tsukamurella paurometabola]